MNRLAIINLSTKAELSLLKDKLYLFLDYLEFGKTSANTIVKTVLEIGFNELFEENEFVIDITITEEAENYYFALKIFTPQAKIYIDKIKSHFKKIKIIRSSEKLSEHLQISVLLNKPNFYPTIKFIKFSQFILTQLSSNEMIKEFQEENKKLKEKIIGLSNERDITEKKLETRSMFLAYLSHEIRTPMSGILGFTDILLKEEKENGRIDYLNKIKNSGNDLLNIVNDILDFSKLEAGMITVENIRFNLIKVLDEIEELFLNQAKSKGLDFKIELDNEIRTAYLIGDPLRLKQVLINLVNNAIKFTHKGYVNVRIESSGEKEEGKNLSFFVEDTGIGIRKNVIAKLFSPYIQADNEISRRFGGTGLGLFICKQLIELMGGIIEVKSSPGKGSVFSFSLPFKVDNSFENEDSGINFKGLRSLIVDSYLIGSEVLAETLMRFGFMSKSIMFSHDALALLEEKALKNEPIDLAIINYDMPFGLNGVQAAKKIKQDSLLKSTKVIIISAYSHDEEINKYAEYIDAFLKKPISQSELLQTVSEIFKDRTPESNSVSENQLSNNDSGLRGLKILLADDSKINQELISELMTSQGVELSIADNGKIAIDRVSNEKFDAILMDVNMPKIDGIMASREIRNDKKNQNIPIIAITAEKENIERHLDDGINDYIIKPFLPDELYSKILKWVPKDKGFNHGYAKIPMKYRYPTKFKKLESIGINVDEGIKRVNGKVKVYESLLNNFRKSYYNLRKDFETAFMTGELPEASRLIHTVKGASGTIGASKLSTLAKEFEIDFKKNYSSNSESKKRFFDQLEKTVYELSKLDEKVKIRDKKKISNEKVKHVINNLQDIHNYLNEDVGLAIGKIDEMVERYKNSDFYDEINNLAEIIYSFNIENAKFAIESFISKHKFT